MNLWNEHGPDQWKKPVTPDDTKEHQAIKLRVQTENAVSKRVSEIFQKSVKLGIAEEISRSIYDVLREENPNEKIEGLYWTLHVLYCRLFEDCDDATSGENTYKKVEVLYKNLFKGYDISLEKLESLKKKQQKFISMIDVNKFKEECMKDSILESYDWREFAKKMFDILEKPSASSYDKYFELRNKKWKEIIKNNKDCRKTESILSNQYLRWREEFKDWVEKVFEVFYNLSSIEPIRTWEEAIDKVTNIWMEEIFWEDTTMLPKDEKESKRISKLSKEERLREIEWETMQNSEKIRLLKNITQEMKDKVREGIRNYYRSHITGGLTVDYYPKYELYDILTNAWIDEKYISRICPVKTTIRINPEDYSITINGNYSSKII